MPSFLEKEQLLTNQPYIANVDAISRTFQTKLQYWAMGASQVKSAYQNYLGLDLTREDNQQKLNEYMQGAKEGIKKASTTDLSVGDNVNSALAIFDPIVKDRNLMGDYAITKHYKNQIGIAESYRSRDGGKEYSDNNLRYLQMKLNDFRTDANADNWQDHASKKGYFTPYYDYSSEIKTAMENYKPSKVTSSVPVKGGYLQSVTDESWRQNDIKNYLSGVLSDKAKKQMDIDGFVSYGENYGQLSNDMNNHIQGLKDQTKAEIENIQYQLDRGNITSDKREQLQQQMTKNLNSQFDLTKQQDKLKDPNYVKSNYEKLTGYYTQNQLINSSSRAFAHEVKSNNFKPDEWQMTIMREAGDDRRARMRIGADLQMNALNNQTKMYEKGIELGLIDWDFVNMRAIPAGGRDVPTQEPTATNNTVENSYDNTLLKMQSIQLQNAKEKKILTDQLTHDLGRPATDADMNNYIAENKSKRSQGLPVPYTYKNFEDATSVNNIALKGYEDKIKEVQTLAVQKQKASIQAIKDKKILTPEELSKLDDYQKNPDKYLTKYQNQYTPLDFSSADATLNPFQYLNRVGEWVNNSSENIGNTLSGNKYADGDIERILNKVKGKGVEGQDVKSLYNSLYYEKFNPITDWRKMTNAKDPRGLKAVNLVKNSTGIPADFDAKDISVKDYSPENGNFNFTLGEETLKKMKKTADDVGKDVGTGTDITYNDKTKVFTYVGKNPMFKMNTGLDDVAVGLKNYFNNFANEYGPGTNTVDSDFQPYKPDLGSNRAYTFKKVATPDRKSIFEVYDITDGNKTKIHIGTAESFEQAIDMTHKLTKGKYNDAQYAALLNHLANPKQ